MTSHELREVKLERYTRSISSNLIVQNERNEKSLKNLKLNSTYQKYIWQRRWSIKYTYTI